MKFKKGMEVFTEDEESVGSVERVVIDPVDREITHLVVKKGVLFTEDRLIPVELISRTSDERVLLKQSADDLGSLQEFEETHYIQALDEEGSEGAAPSAVPPLYWYPPLGFSMSRLVSEDLTHYVSRRERNIPDELVPLKEGARVIAADDSKLGNVEQVFSAPVTNKITHVLLTVKGISKQMKIVPVTWIQRISEDEVQLGVNQDQIDALPDYEKGED